MRRFLVVATLNPLTEPPPSLRDAGVLTAEAGEAPQYAGHLELSLHRTAVRMSPKFLPHLTLNPSQDSFPSCPMTCIRVYSRAQK